METIDKWVVSFCLVTFDNTTGPRISLIYPKNIGYSKKGKSNIGFYSLPDSGFAKTCTLTYSFMIKTKAKPLYGYVYYSSKKDPTNKRNYTHKSIVLITSYEFQNLFSDLISCVGKYALEGSSPSSVFKKAYTEIQTTWPTSIRKGKRYLFPILGHSLSAIIPTRYVGSFRKRNNKIPIKLFTPLPSFKKRNAKKKNSNTNQKKKISTPTKSKLYPNKKPKLTKSNTKLTSTDSNSNTDRGIDSSSRSISSSPLIVSHEHKKKNSNHKNEKANNTKSSNPKNNNKGALIDKNISNALNRYVSICIPGFVGLETNLYLVFKGVLPSLTLLWQLMIMGENILLSSNSPQFSSQAVLGLGSLLFPIQFKGELYPYFTMNNTGFKSFASNGKAHATIIGTTNPFFSEKAFQHWTNKISVGNHQNTIKVQYNNRNSNSDSSTSNSNSNSDNSTNSGSNRNNTKSNSSKLIFKSPKIKFNKIKKKDLQFPEKVVSKIKPIIKFPSSFLKKLKKIDTTSDLDKQYTQKNVSIRQFFWDLNMAFLTPLQQYFMSLVPLKRKTEPFSNSLVFKGFKEKEFLFKFLNMELQFEYKNRTKWVDIYKNFIHSSSFYFWYDTMKQSVLKKFQKRCKQAIFALDIAKKIKSLKNDEKVEFFRKILKRYRSSIRGTDQKLINVLKKYLIQIIDSLPKEFHENLYLEMENISKEK
ncbi:hypothetical protein M0812_01724 [Anaeramoeba flamelloides]|uniref:UDENN domain-containing protein n=1 Tax=Anaeramoeba flamelloides TaxID=1746091 RepID=A0AAV7Z0V7_9EUKA|nr:hypothetical protein M0812_01724 [Anaeramoeba flamelloides]